MLCFSNKNSESLLLLILIALLLTGMSSCKKHEPKNLVPPPDKIIERIQSKLPKPISVEVQRRINKAVSELNNNKTDNTPILFYAFVLRQPDSEEYTLHIAYYDEDANLLGVGIREVNNGSGLSKILEERYPIYLQHSQPPVWIAYLPVKKRTAKQTKDETVWSHYMRSEGEYSIFKEKIPPLWISLPDDPNNIPEVFIYDKDGNVSEFIPVEVKRNYEDT